MSKGKVNLNQTAIEYYTPKSLVDMFGKFDYDPATTAEQAKRLGIPNYDTKDTDGLKADWSQYMRIWINPLQPNAMGIPVDYVWRDGRSLCHECNKKEAKK